MLRQLKTKFASEFVKNSLTIFTGNLIAQAIPFLAEPILARLFAPSDFAVLALYLSVANLFSIIATARYEMAIVLPKSDKQAINVVGLSVIISLIVSVLSLIIVWVFNVKICQILKNEDISSYLFLVPLTTLSIAWYQIFNYWNVRKKQFRNVAIAKTSQSVSNVGITVGLASFKSAGLILGQIFGYFFGMIVMLFRFLQKDRKQLKDISKEDMKSVAITYQDFPKINSFHAFCDVLKQSGEVFLISFYYLKEQVGLHSRTLRLLFAPSALLGAAIGQVFYQKASETYQNNGDLKALVKKVLGSLFLISFPAFLAVALWGDDLFAWFLGEPYRLSGYYGKFLTPWLFFSFILSPVSQIPLIVNKQKASFFRNIIGHTLYLTAIVIGGIYNNIILGFALISAFSILYHTYYIFWLIKISGRKPITETMC